MGFVCVCTKVTVLSLYGLETVWKWSGNSGVSVYVDMCVGVD